MEGSKEEVAQITANVSTQLKGLTSPSLLQDIANTEEANAIEIVALPSALKQTKKRAKKPNGQTSSTTKNQSKEAIDYKLDTKKYNSPTQEWSTQQKALWVLYVAKHEASRGQLSASLIATTYNKHHKQSGTIWSNNVSRDFGKIKQGSSALVGEDTRVTPGEWYLTDKGVATVQNLIKGTTE